MSDKRVREALQDESVPNIAGIGILGAAVFGAMFTFVPMDDFSGENNQALTEHQIVMHQSFNEAAEALIEDNTMFDLYNNDATQQTLAGLHDLGSSIESKPQSDELTQKFNAHMADLNKFLDLLATDKVLPEKHKDNFLTELKEHDLIPEDHPAYQANLRYLEECQQEHTDPDKIYAATAEMDEDFKDGIPMRGLPFVLIMLLAGGLGIARGFTSPRKKAPKYNH